MNKRRTGAKAAPFKATPVPNLFGKGPDDTITRAELVALIADRKVRGSADDGATVRNKISSKVYDDIVRTRKLRRESSGLFTLGNIANWTATEYPGEFDDLPTYPRTGIAMMTEAGDTSSASACALPLSLEVAHQQILELNQHIRATEQALADTKRKLEKDAPFAKKWLTTQEKKRGPRNK